MQSFYAAPAIFFWLLCGLSILADWLAARRRKVSPERLGLIPWPLILILSLLLAATFTALWIRDV